MAERRERQGALGTSCAETFVIGRGGGEAEEWAGAQKDMYRPYGYKPPQYM